MLQTLIVLLLALKVGASVGLSRRLAAWLAIPVLAGLPFALLEPELALPLSRVALLGGAWGLALSLLQVSRWNLRLRPGVAAIVALLALEGGAITLLGLERFAPGASPIGGLSVLGAGLACALAGGVTGTTKEAAQASGRARLGAAVCALGVGLSWYLEAGQVAASSGAGMAYEAQANHSVVAGWALLLLAVTAAPPVLAGLHGRWVRRWGPLLAGAAALALPATALALGASLDATCEDHGRGGPAWCSDVSQPAACAQAQEISVDAGSGLRSLDEPVPLVSLRRDWGASVTAVDACFRASVDARPQPYRVGLLFDEGGQVTAARAVPLWQAGEVERELSSCLDRVFEAMVVPAAACHELDQLIVSFYGGEAKALPLAPEEEDAQR